MSLLLLDRPGPGIRRQLSLFVPGDIGRRIDAVRAQLDPIQHDFIPAHVTLARETEIVDWKLLEAQLLALGQIRVELTFRPPQQLQDGCILLPAAGSTADFDHLRSDLLFYAGKRHQPDPPQALPHITLRHPRNLPELQARGLGLGFQGIGASGRQDLRSLSETVIFERVSIIEQEVGQRWKVLGEYPPSIPPRTTSSR